MTIIEALRDRDLLGRLPSFQNLTTWKLWLIFLSALYGLPLSSSQDEDLFCTYTGRSKYDPPAGGFPEAAAIVGRQSGKTEIAGVILGHEAQAFTPVSDGVDRYALAIGQEARASVRTVFAAMTAPYRLVPALRSLVEGEPTVDTCRLITNVVLAAYPCLPRSVRGLKAVCVALDEFAHYQNAEGNPVALEMLRAARPTLAMSGGKLIILSSPYFSEGPLYDLHARHYGQDDSSTLVWQSSAQAMNPTLPADYLARMERDDPEAFASEVLGQFRTGSSALFDPAAIEACVMTGVREIA